MSQDTRDETVTLITAETKKLIAEAIDNKAKEKSKDYRSFINKAKANLKALNKEVIKTSFLKLGISVFFFIVGAGLIYFASDKYDNASKEIPDITKRALETFNISMITINSEIRLLKILEENHSIKNQECRHATNYFNNKNNPNIVALAYKKDKVPEKTFNAATNEKKTHQKICEKEYLLKLKVDSSRKRLEKHENELAKINPIISPLRKNVGSSYMLLFFSISSLLTSIFSLMSFIKSREKSKEIRLKINQYHRFELAATQCDILQATEDKPEMLMNKIFETVSPKVDKDEIKNGDLFNLLGKLKIPQRKSVEVRAELIKEIYKFHEIDFK